MNIGVVGVNHNLAPINIREAVSFTDTKKIEAINILLDRDINEVVILSTCNRSEIYIHAENIEEKRRRRRKIKWINLSQRYIAGYSRGHSVRHCLFFPTENLKFLTALPITPRPLKQFQFVEQIGRCFSGI